MDAPHQPRFGCFIEPPTIFFSGLFDFIFPLAFLANGLVLASSTTDELFPD